MCDETQKKSITARLLDHAWAIRIAALTSIVGLPLSLYFFWASIQERKLSYYVSPNVTTIVQSNSLSDLSVSYQGTPVTNGLYVAQIVIWNEGKLAIEKGDVMDPLTLIPSKDVRVVQISFAKKSRDITRFDVQSNAPIDNIRFNWDILEHEDGGVLQVFFTGDPKGEFEMACTIKGQKQIRRFTSAIEKTSLWQVLFFFGGLTFVGWSFGSAIREMVKAARTLRKHDPSWTDYAVIGGVIFIAISVLALSGYVAFEHLLRYKTVPFGF